jgi:ribonuclease R
VRSSRPGAADTGARARESRVVWPPGARETARAAIEDLLRERGMSGDFYERVLREAAEAYERGPERASAQRRDLTALPTFTVDPQSARDFDDAVSAEELAGGHARLWVHIADVAAFVREGSALDAEARERATSVYVPGSVRPMLPELLSSDACSLTPGAERLAVTVELELRGAEALNAAFYRSVIRSDARLDYEQVDRIFAGEELACEPWRAPLEAARRVAAALARERESRGALTIDSMEPEFCFDEDGEIGEIRARTQTEAHRLIEHLMIAANEAVARLLAARRVPCLYRVHEQPDPQGIARLVDQLASLDVPTPPLPDPMSPSQAAELAGAISRLVEQTVRRRGHGGGALGSLVLRSLKQAYYLPRNLGHAGLRSAAYCHFTSPIRRYPDLVCHRALLSAVGAGEEPPRAAELAELGAWTSDREREAMLIERDADDVARCFALERALYQTDWQRTFTGEVVGLISAGAFIAFGGTVEVIGESASGHVPERAAATSGAHVYEGMLPVRRLRTDPSEWWELGELGTIMHARPSGAMLRLGEQIEVRVARIDAPRGRVELAPAEAEPPQ